MTGLVTGLGLQVGMQLLNTNTNTGSHVIGPLSHQPRSHMALTRLLNLVFNYADPGKLIQTLTPLGQEAFS